MNHELKMRLAEVVAPKVYEIIKGQYGNEPWEEQPRHLREQFIQEEYDVTAPILEALLEVYTEGSIASEQLIGLLGG